MIDVLPPTVRHPVCDGFEITSSGRSLLDALDAWLADDQARDDYVHVHSWVDSDNENDGPRVTALNRGLPEATS